MLFVENIIQFNIIIHMLYKQHICSKIKKKKQVLQFTNSKIREHFSQKDSEFTVITPTVKAMAEDKRKRQLTELGMRIMHLLLNC